jgi:hypothetical protein
MSAPLQRELQRDDSILDPRLYAPPWARERPLPVAGQPQSIGSPPVASAQPDASLPEPRSSGTPHMPKKGPNVDCPPRYGTQSSFGGDVAVHALRRRLSLDPELVPQPPIVLASDSTWNVRVVFVLLAVGALSFGAAFLTTADRSRLTRTDEPSVSTHEATASHPREPAQLLVENGKAPVNEPLPLGVSVQGASGGEFLLLSGLAAGTRLSAGDAFGTQGWRVMGRDLSGVFAYAPANYVGAMEAAIDLRSVDDRLLDSQIVRMEWTPKNEIVVQPPPAVAAPARQLEPNEVARLLERGGQFLQIGDVSAARLMLRRAADAGSAEGALGLGATFDPAVLRQIGALGVAPNLAQARQWYQKAAELGSQEAAHRIERLPR